VQDAPRIGKGFVAMKLPRTPVPIHSLLAMTLALGFAAYGRASDPLIPQIPEVMPLPDAMIVAKKQAPKPNDANKPLVWKKWIPTGKPLTLKECLDIGQENQPAVKAAKASLASGERGYLGLQNFSRALELISADLPVRRLQAQKGIVAASAEVLKAQQEVTYDVTRMYFTYVYATQQEVTANDIVEQMETFYRVAEDILKAGVIDPKVKINNFTLYALDDAIGEIRRLRDKASLGRKQALAALKEAMGVDQAFELVPATAELPLMAGTVALEEVTALAMSRRTELVQAAVVLDVTRLEVCAQSKLGHRKTVQTFAAGSDLHSRVLPAPLRNGEYRPGPVAPEMPTILAGSRDDRVSRALALCDRQEAVYEKVVGLVKLEAANAFLTWQSTAERVKEAKVRYDRGLKVLEESRAAAAARNDPELLVKNEALAGKAQAEYLEAVQRLIEALVNLERVTGGGVRPDFPGR